MKHLRLFEEYDSGKKAMRLWQFLSPEGRKEVLDGYDMTDQSNMDWADLDHEIKRTIEIHVVPYMYDSTSKQEDWKAFFGYNE